MFYDTFAIIYKAYDYKLVFLFDLLTTRIIFFDQSLKWTRRQNVYFFKISFILYLHTIFVAIWTIFRCNTFATKIK